MTAPQPTAGSTPPATELACPEPCSPKPSRCGSPERDPRGRDVAFDASQLISAVAGPTAHYERLGDATSTAELGLGSRSRG